MHRHEEIKKLLLGDKPCSIGKLGTVELINFYHYNLNPDYSRPTQMLSVNAGLNFKDDMEYFDWNFDVGEALKNLSVVLSWATDSLEQAEKKILSEHCADSIVVGNFTDIEPFSHGEKGWHYCLEDKKVLVVSSFKASIEAQIPNFGKIWPNAKLGSCEVIKSHLPHQITGGQERFYNETLSSLYQQIWLKDFDIAIVGCGGYSLPVCEMIRKMGKKAIHLGGATQVLFGIRGSRFDRNFADQSWYGTEAFIKPLGSDIPKNYMMVEGGCYW